jgi:hypothetical protein
VSTVRLGYEVGTGAAVEIPLKHLAICGQTQEAGKTTALEALITRSGLRAVTFVTKRGEASFTDARRIDPYFREQADWQFVASILEASRGEKLKFERAWIIRAAKGARTLADVQRNVRTAMEKAKGMSADVYLTLDAYLDAVVPVIARVRWAPGLELHPGVNAIDLTHVPAEMQHLVIKSCLDWVLEREHGTVVVIPEAWKFIPQGRGTPVKLAAEAFIRQGAAMRNLLWLDSQDLGGIEKTILRSVPVWLLGVQREANEIKRTLSNVHSAKKPKPGDIATLELGQFYACFGGQAIKTYAWPAWMRDEKEAVAIARGDRSPLMADTPYRFVKEETVNEREAKELRDENARLKLENENFARRIEALERAAVRAGGSIPADTARPAPPAERAQQPAAAAPAPFPSGHLPIDSDTEGLYQAFKARLIAELPSDPRVMEIVVSQPELHVRVQRKRLLMDDSTLGGRIAVLLHEGWFEEIRGASATSGEMARRGWNHDYRHIDRACRGLAEQGFFRIEAGRGFIAVPSMKVYLEEGATV